MKKKDLFISTSAGETSEYLAHELLFTEWRRRYNRVINLFANTGEENEETLEFLHKCDLHFGFNTVWLEAVVHPRKGDGTTHRVVTFETASRNGEPFEEVIKKYGIPNAKFSHCTRELKQAAMYSYVRSLGWKRGSYDVAIGIRADEIDRCGNEPNIIYPFAHWRPTTKPDVNTFWRDQPFRLNLTGYQGNCKWCWKKSLRKHMTIMDESPQKFDFPARMEAQYATVGPEFAKKTAEGYKRTFFRHNMSVADLKRVYLTDSTWERAENDAIVYNDAHVPLDSDAGCVESCEVEWKPKEI